MSTTVDYLLLRHSESIYFEPNAIPQLPVVAARGLFQIIGDGIRYLGRWFTKLVSLNLQSRIPMAYSKSPYAQIGVKGLY